MLTSNTNFLCVTLSGLYAFLTLSQRFTLGYVKPAFQAIPSTLKGLSIFSLGQRPSFFLNQIMNPVRVPQLIVHTQTSINKEFQHESKPQHQKPRTSPPPSPLPNALLLIGPTGSGKTPLGEYAETHGYNGHRCTHFDFGEALRHIDTTKTPVGTLTTADVTFIHKVLTEGALLEDDTFYIAEELIKAHIATSKITKDDYLLLNGLPRHIGQANAIDEIVNITHVINLHCTPETVYQRISQNSGGDRTTRIDDTTQEIANKLKIFETRTKPLIDHYANLNIKITTTEITPNSTPSSIWTAIQQC